MASTSVVTVKIKRKRDEPALPGFVLGGSAASQKRQSLAKLSLGPAAADVAQPAAAAAQPADAAADAPTNGAADFSAGSASSTISSRPRVRFKLVGTRNAAGFAVRDERLQRGQRRQGAQQTSARYQRVATHRLDGDTGSDTKGVELELRRCPPPPPPKPKLVPFGAPLPPSGKPVEKAAAFGSSSPSGWAAAAAADEDDPLASVWRDAAAAASLPVADGPAADGEGGSMEADDEFVYDIYEVEVGATDEAPGAAEAVDDLWYEELDPAAMHGLEEMMSAADSDSEDEVDYPDEESSSAASGGEYDDDDGDDEPRWKARDGHGGSSSDYLDLL